MRDSSEFFVRDQQTALTTSTNMMRACPPTYHLERTQRVMIQSTASHKRHSMQISVRKSEQNKCVHLVLFMDRPVNWAMGSACDRCLAQLLGAVYVPSTVPTVDWVVLGFVESHREAAMSAACLQTHCRNMIIIITRFPVLRTRYVKQHRRNIVYYDSDVIIRICGRVGCPASVARSLVVRLRETSRVRARLHSHRHLLSCAFLPVNTSPMLAF